MLVLNYIFLKKDGAIIINVLICSRIYESVKLALHSLSFNKKFPAQSLKDLLILGNKILITTDIF